MILVVCGNFGGSFVLVRVCFPLREGGNAVRFCHLVFFVFGSVSFVVFSPFFFS